MKTSIILALFSMLLLGCNKETVNFHIKIINPATGEGYANHEFYIKSSRTGANGENVKTRYSGTTNENGEAIVTLKVNKDTWFLTCEAVPNTCYINNPKQHYSNRADLNPEFVFEIAPCAQLKMKVKNINCLGESDIISITMTNTVNSLSPNPWILNGCADYETVNTNVPMGLYNVNWTVTKSNITTNHSDSFYLQENEYKFYVIEY